MKMKRPIATFSKSGIESRRNNERGIAMATTLLLLMLLIAVSLTMVLSTSSDLLINGYYRNFRGAFYAADSGLNIARQDLSNQLQSYVPATFSASAQPIPAGSDSTVATYIASTYGSSFTALNAGSAGSSWLASYEITTACVGNNPVATCASMTPSSCTLSGTTGTCT